MANGNKTKNGSLTYREMYELVDNKISNSNKLLDDRTKSIDSKIQHLFDKFDQLEAGRLSAVETEIAKLKAQIVVWGAVAMALFTVAGILLDNFIK